MRPSSRIAVLPAVVLTSAAAAAPAISAAAARTGFFRPGFVDCHGAPIELAAVEGGNRPLTSGIIGHLDEGEALRPSGVTIRDHINAIHRSVLFEQSAKRIFGGAVAEVSYKDVFH